MKTHGFRQCPRCGLYNKGQDESVDQCLLRWERELTLDQDRLLDAAVRLAKWVKEVSYDKEKIRELRKIKEGA